MDIVGKGRRVKVRYLERVTWKLTIPYVKQIASGNLLYDSGNSNGGLCDSLEGWRESSGEGDGKEVQEGGGHGKKKKVVYRRKLQCQPMFESINEVCKGNCFPPPPHLPSGMSVVRYRNNRHLP